MIIVAWDRVRGEVVFAHEYVMVAAILLAFRTRTISENKTKSKKLTSEIYLTTRTRTDRCKNEDGRGDLLHSSGSRSDQC
jgi:hypothetical protein